MLEHLLLGASYEVSIVRLNKSLIEPNIRFFYGSPNVIIRPAFWWPNCVDFYRGFMWMNACRLAIYLNNQLTCAVTYS